MILKTSGSTLCPSLSHSNLCWYTLQLPICRPLCCHGRLLPTPTSTQTFPVLAGIGGRVLSPITAFKQYPGHGWGGGKWHWEGTSIRHILTLGLAELEGARDRAQRRPELRSRRLTATVPARKPELKDPQHQNGKQSHLASPTAPLPRTLPGPWNSGNLVELTQVGGELNGALRVRSPDPPWTTPSALRLGFSWGVNKAEGTGKHTCRHLAVLTAALSLPSSAVAVSIRFSVVLNCSRHRCSPRRI